MAKKQSVNFILRDNSNVAQVKRIAKKYNGAFIMKQTSGGLICLDFEFESIREKNAFINETYDKVSGIEDHGD